MPAEGEYKIVPKDVPEGYIYWLGEYENKILVYFDGRNTPTTGDESMPVLWAVLALSAAAGAAICLKKRKAL